MSRTEMKCELCGGFSSTVRCYPCSSSGAGIALFEAEARITELVPVGDSNMPTMKNPSHPGRIVRRAIIEGLGVSVTDAAKSLKISRKHLSAIMNERSGISPKMAIRLEKGIGSTAEAWLQMQLNFDLAQTLQAERKIKVKRLARR